MAAVGEQPAGTLHRTLIECTRPWRIVPQPKNAMSRRI